MTQALKLLSEQFAFWSAEPETSIPPSEPGSSLWSVSEVRGHLSALTPIGNVPQGTKFDGPWRAFRVSANEADSAASLMRALDALDRAGVDARALGSASAVHVLVAEVSLDAARAALAPHFDVVPDDA